MTMQHALQLQKPWETIRRLILGVRRKRLAGPTPRLHDTHDRRGYCRQSSLPPRGNSQDVGRRNNQSGSSTGMKHAGLSGGGIQSDELLPNAGMGSSAGLQGAPTGGTESLNDLQPM